MQQKRSRQSSQNVQRIIRKSHRVNVHFAAQEKRCARNHKACERSPSADREFRLRPKISRRIKNDRRNSDKKSERIFKIQAERPDNNRKQHRGAAPPRNFFAKLNSPRHQNSASKNQIGPTPKFPVKMLSANFGGVEKSFRRNASIAYLNITAAAKIRYGKSKRRRSDRNNLPTVFGRKKNPDTMKNSGM